MLIESFLCIICLCGIYNRDLTTKENVKDKTIVKKQVAGVKQSSETCIIAESIGTMWSLVDSQWSLQPKKKSNEGDHLFEIMGSKLVVIHCISLYLGKKKWRIAQDFILLDDRIIDNAFFICHKCLHD